MQVPVDMVAIGDYRLGLKRKRVTQHSIANCRGEKRSRHIVTVRAAGAREEQQPKVVGTRISGRKRCQIPRLAERLAAGGDQGQRISPGRLETGGIELPECTVSVVHPATDGSRTDPQGWRGR